MTQVSLWFANTIKKHLRTILTGEMSLLSNGIIVGPFTSHAHFVVVKRKMVLLIAADVGRIGIGICYDIRFQELAMMYAARGESLYYI